MAYSMGARTRLWISRLVLCVISVFGWAGPLAAVPITITKQRDLEMGICDAVPTTVYITKPNKNNPGAQSCPGAQSAWYKVRGDPSVSFILIVTTPVTTSNGVNNLNVKLRFNLTNLIGTLNASGKKNVFIGGRIKIPAGGKQSGVYTAVGHPVDVAYN